ncbi:MAG: polyamine aminopropyltransferase [Chromatiaceae bacterium]|nr:polyamine aminopropyltransferase [Gammaproteobacteria bacterium]MCP5300792.1 polyamine aminopropyltransferase [Chromatiaceae bacterium]MCP5422864.1 polyamine aminopropyltransferase [Chromatiaceae bacterium]
MSLDDNWITEICADGGSAFSLQRRAKLFEQRSPFQKVEVFDTETYGKLMLIDGCTMVSTRENFLYHEMMSHPVLYSHPAPRRVAIIGGGDCGTLREVLRHPEVERVTQIDIDATVTRAAELHFPELCESNDDARAELLFIDGIQWMKDAEPGSLDVIIVDSTDPIGPGEVLFTPEFYGACQRALGDDGLVVQQSESPLIHMPVLERMYRSLKAAGFADARTLFFPQPIYPTGWWSATIGAKRGRLGAFRRDDVDARGFDTAYYNAAIHAAAFAEPEFFRRARERWWSSA